MAHSTRPTLPPLHTLDLPRGDAPPRIHQLYDLDDLSRRTAQLHIPSTLPNHPISSSTSSRPPVPCLRPRTNTPASTTPFPVRKIRLVPTSFENANAVVLVSPPSASDAPTPQPLLLVGPALQRLRRHQRQLAKGARVHPYRIAGPSDRRPQTGPSHSKA